MSVQSQKRLLSKFDRFTQLKRKYLCFYLWDWMECSTKKAESIQKKEIKKRENKRRGDTSKCHGQFGGGQTTGETGWRTGNRRDKMRSTALQILPVDGETGRWVNEWTPAACTTEAQADEQDEEGKNKKGRHLENITMVKYQVDVRGWKHTAAWEWKISPPKEVMNKKNGELKWKKKQLGHWK